MGKERRVAMVSLALGRLKDRRPEAFLVRAATPASVTFSVAFKMSVWSFSGILAKHASDRFSLDERFK